PDGKTLASGSYDPDDEHGLVQLWDPVKGRALAAFKSPEHEAGFVRSLVYSRDGKWLIGGADSRHVWIWDAASGEMIGSLDCQPSAIWSVAVSPDRRWLAAAGGEGDNNIMIWDTAIRAGFMALLPLGAADWVASSPDGLVDGTPAGLQQMAWRQGNALAAFDTYQLQYLVPGLWAKRRAGQPSQYR
ncbi:MAG: hypothetical protein JO247_08650, partial [Chloroflexi bacterium]|nr:hypothetical protein [Chloroflexota bacterium]